MGPYLSQPVQNCQSCYIQHRDRFYEENSKRFCPWKAGYILSLIQHIDYIRTMYSCRVLFVPSFKKRNVLLLLLFWFGFQQNVLSNPRYEATWFIYWWQKANDSQLSEVESEECLVLVACWLANCVVSVIIRRHITCIVSRFGFPRRLSFLFKSCGM